MSSKDFPKIDPSMLGRTQKLAEPKIVLWAGGKPTVALAPGATAQRPPEPPAPTVDWSALRKAEPANVLLPATRTWAQSLPIGIVPRTLMAQFPRIANRVALDWRDPMHVRTYLSELLVDRRGGRRGFPADVLDDILRLRRYCASRSPLGLDRHD